MNISIVGTGYVGLVTGTCLAETGNQILCLDNDQSKLQKLKHSQITIYEPGLEVLFQRNIDKGRLSFTDNMQLAVLKSEIIFLCLPTPQDEDGSADLQYVLAVTKEIGSILRDSNPTYKIIVNKSTVPVGTANRLSKVLDDCRVQDYDIVSNPEFLREGFAVDDFMKPDRIVIGTSSPHALETMKQLYEPFVRQGNPIIAMDIASAEVTKYAANSYLAMRITYMNEIANFCEKVGADVDAVRTGMAADNRIGKRFLFPGIGYGGSCFPKDVKALIKTSKESSSEIKILSAVDQVNDRQKLRLVEKLTSCFPEGLRGRHFALWGLAFKPNTDDVREAPAITMVKALLELGSTVSAYDPAAMETAKQVLGSSIRYANSDYDALEGADALIIATEWNEFRNPDFAKVKALLKRSLIFDGRNIYRPEHMKELGFTYYSIGRAAVE